MSTGELYPARTAATAKLLGTGILSSPAGMVDYTATSAFSVTAVNGATGTAAATGSNSLLISGLVSRLRIQLAGMDI